MTYQTLFRSSCPRMAQAQNIRPRGMQLVASPVAIMATRLSGLVGGAAAAPDLHAEAACRRSRAVELSAKNGGLLLLLLLLVLVAVAEAAAAAAQVAVADKPWSILRLCAGPISALRLVCQATSLRKKTKNGGWAQVIEKNKKSAWHVKFLSDRRHHSQKTKKVSRPQKLEKTVSHIEKVSRRSSSCWTGDITQKQQKS